MSSQPQIRHDVLTALSDDVHRNAADIVEFRRDIHAHPETSGSEQRTTAQIITTLERAGLSANPLPGSGVTFDIVPDGMESRQIIALRGDIDALPIQEETGLAFASKTAGVAHACGHDIHTSVVVGAGLALHNMAQRGDLPAPVRLIFQPAEESPVGGAPDVIAAGRLDKVRQIFALHCDPSLDVGQVGLRVGAITSASDHITVKLSGRGGHTSRPHLSEDVVFALGKLVTELPSVMSRRLDPRSSASIVWGRVRAGTSGNAIASHGSVEGTLRVMNVADWEALEVLFPQWVHEILAPYGVSVEINHFRVVPPVLNDEQSAHFVDRTARTIWGDTAVVGVEQSLGGEDFSWYTRQVPGALSRLGTRTPGGRTYDLHQGDFVADEGALLVGTRLLAGVALTAGLDADKAR